VEQTGCEPRHEPDVARSREDTDGQIENAHGLARTAEAYEAEQLPFLNGEGPLHYGRCSVSRDPRLLCEGVQMEWS
jgi:hypothetical protein